MSDDWIKFPTEPGIWATSRFSSGSKLWCEPMYVKIQAAQELGC